MRDYSKPFVKCATFVSLHMGKGNVTKPFDRQHTGNRFVNVTVDFEAYLDTVRDGLLAAWKLRGKRKRQMSITLRHALRFSTWQSLERENLKDKQIADLVMVWIQTTSE